MARASTAAENRAISGVFATTTPTVSATAYYMSLHTADPGTTGANEYSGVTRQVFPAGAASGGAVSNSSSMSFTTSGASAVTHIGIWDAATAGNFVIGAALGSSVTATTITIAAGAASFSAS
ncbi:MAG: phage tail fiber protein [Blastococcus sp.]